MTVFSDPIRGKKKNKTTTYIAFKMDMIIQICTLGPYLCLYLFKPPTLPPVWVLYKNKSELSARTIQPKNVSTEQEFVAVKTPTMLIPIKRHGSWTNSPGKPISVRDRWANYVIKLMLGDGLLKWCCSLKFNSRTWPSNFYRGDRKSMTSSHSSNPSNPTCVPRGNG